MGIYHLDRGGVRLPCKVADEEVLWGKVGVSMSRSAVVNMDYIEFRDGDFQTKNRCKRGDNVCFELKGDEGGGMGEKVIGIGGISEGVSLARCSNEV